jgi:mono/diheme cytochrome c family protein
MVCCASTAQALSPEAQRGQVFVRANCSLCHAIGRHDKSPLPVAPAFRDLHEKYPVEFLGEAFGEGIVTAHPSMPQFQLDPGQIEDLVAYLKSLEGPAQ